MRTLLATATVVDGLLAGASVDQSVEQLPARHRIGLRAYQQYSQASHMANGRFWLIPLGIGGPVLRIAAAIGARGLSSRRAVPVYVAGALGVAHALSTVKAAGINLAIAPWQPPERRTLAEDALSDIFYRFERWQALRASLQLLTFAAGVWALAVNASANDDWPSSANSVHQPGQLRIMPKSPAQLDARRSPIVGVGRFATASWLRGVGVPQRMSLA
jgi:hypothetical protein